MPSARQVEINESSNLFTDHLRADLHSLLREIHAVNISNLNSLHARGKVLFAEGESPRGVYILRTGRASVSISSHNGSLVILRIAHAGDVLGINSVLRNCPYDTTVKTCEPCRTDFIPRAELMRLMERSPTGAQALLKILSRELTELTERARSLLLPQTVGARLAKLLLEWTRQQEADESGAVRIDRSFTQEEMAQMICSSRETVTRLLANLSRREIIQITTDSIVIRDHAALQTVAHDF